MIKALSMWVRKALIIILSLIVTTIVVICWGRMYIILGWRYINVRLCIIVKWWILFLLQLLSHNFKNFFLSTNNLPKFILDSMILFFAKSNQLIYFLLQWWSNPGADLCFSTAFILVCSHKRNRSMGTISFSGVNLRS